MPRWDSMHTATFLKGGKCHKGLFFVGNVGVIQIILSSNKKSCSFSHCLFHLFYMFPKNRDQFYDKSFLHVNAAQNVGAAPPRPLMPTCLRDSKSKRSWLRIYTYTYILCTAWGSLLIMSKRIDSV